jgi:rhodanese-related sulfurtransferase/DNA-binding transcriptional ArsR family regulator
MTEIRLKTAVYEQIARIGKAMASPPRLEIVDLLSQGAFSVEGIAGQIGQSLANTSRHLQILRAARLVTAEKRGVFVRYRLADREVEDFVLRLRRLARSRLTDYVERRGALEPVMNEQLRERIESGEVTLIDVRPREEYEAAHIPHAISFPLAELEARHAELPQNREIVAYCRGPYCVMAFDAVELLRGRGYEASRMEDGVAEWRARGGRIVSGNRP